MAGITASKPMNIIRGKGKINEPTKPKGRANKHNGPTWQE